MISLSITLLIASSQLLGFGGEGDPPRKMKKDGMKLAVVHEEMVVNASPAEAWKVLADEYINVGDYQHGIYESGGEAGMPETGNGAGRYCKIKFGKRDILVKEKIVEWQEGETEKEYTYDVYEWKNYPLKKMYNTWGVKLNDKGETVLYNTIYYRLKPRMMTGMVRGQMVGAAINAILGYKHFLETGRKNIPPDELRVAYDL